MDAAKPTKIAKQSSSQSYDKDPATLYLAQLSKMPVLTKEQEQDYFIRYKDGDKVAYNKIVEGNLRLVVKIAKRYTNRGLAMLDRSFILSLIAKAMGIPQENVIPNIICGQAMYLLLNGYIIVNNAPIIARIIVVIFRKNNKMPNAQLSINMLSNAVFNDICPLASGLFFVLSTRISRSIATSYTAPCPVASSETITSSGYKRLTCNSLARCDNSFTALS